VTAYIAYRSADGRAWVERVPPAPGVGRRVWLALWKRDRERQGSYGFRQLGAAQWRALYAGHRAAARLWTEGEGR
jgi:hypothetical protein